MNWLTLIPELLRLVPAVQKEFEVGISYKSVIDAIENPNLLTAFTDLGAQLFPKVAPELHAAAAIITSYNPNNTMWVQNSLNKLVTPSPMLEVDGYYGPKTRAAVEALQVQLGLKIDGWAGNITQAAIQLALTKVS